MSITYDFTGKTAIITGGTDGIGNAIAKSLSSAGANVCVWDLKAPDDKNFDYYYVDVCDDDQIARATNAIIEKYGSIDILVNNAGFAGSTVPVDQYDPQEWRRIIDVNLIGVYQVCRHVLHCFN